jgi:altronate hydrolase
MGVDNNPIEPATGEAEVIRLHPADNVVVACRQIAEGQSLRVAGHEVRAIQAVPPGHKIALLPIDAGSVVLRYGESIGLARQRIERGEHVHVHNLAYVEPLIVDDLAEWELALPSSRPDAPTFLGFSRHDGRAGTRNYVAVVAASNCAAHVAGLVAESYRGAALPGSVDGVVAFCHGDGCSHAHGPDTEQLLRTIAGVIDHPNVSGAVMIGLGFEENCAELYRGLRDPDHLTILNIQSSGGTQGTVQAARRAIDRQIERATAETRVELPISKIVLGLNCGGSDSFSGVTANPALGACVDILAGFGGTAVLAETPEISGAVHLLARRARNRVVAQRLLGQVRSYAEYLQRFGSSFNDNLSPGNMEGGLSNILEKSLGAAAKSGTSPLTEVYGYAERVDSPGFVFMNTPGYDPVSLAGLGAGGVNLIAFTTGRGSAIGFPTVPVIKIASNSAVRRQMPGNIDLNAGRILDGEATIEEIGRDIFDFALRVASGERTCSERLGHSEFVPWRIGPVL